MFLNDAAKLAGIYKRLPAFVQNLGLSAAGLQVRLVRYNRRYDNLYREATVRDGWRPEQTAVYLDAQVRRFVSHAAATVPHYRDLFRDRGIDPRRIGGFDDLAALPILTKAEVQDAPERFVSEAAPARRHIHTHTSGTTGAALRFVTTMDAVRRQWAIWWRYRTWHGITPGTEVAIFRALPIVPLTQTAPPYWRYNRPGRELYLSAAHFSPESIRHFAAELNRRRTPWLHGYPSSLAAFAAYLLDGAIRLDYPLRWVTTGSENLTPQHKLLIARAFGVQPINRYGLNEAVANISEQTDGALYVDEDFAAVEFVDGRILGTNLTNDAFPLIRYETGDTGTADGSRDHRGRRRVTALDGRSDDYVLRRDGTRLTRLDLMFRDSINVREAQIRQRRAGEVTLKLVRRASFTPKDEHDLMTIAHAYLGADMAVAVEYVDRIDRPASGKPRLVDADPSLRAG